MLVLLCIRGHLSQCTVVLCRQHLLAVAAPGPVAEGQAPRCRLSSWEQSGMLCCRAEPVLGTVSVAAMVPLPW